MIIFADLSSIDHAKIIGNSSKNLGEYVLFF